MQKLLALCLAFAVVACSSNKKTEEKKIEKPNIAFEISEGILHPESILFSPKHNHFFVSNVASGNPTETKPVGYMSKISADGKIVTSKWVTGLHAPKGMGIVGDDLYVTDVTRVVKISISRAKITKTFTVKGSKFLNDIAVDKDGNIYISDMFSDILYRIQKDKLGTWVKDAKVAGSNGLYTDGKEHVIAVKWGTDVDPKTFMAKVPGDVAIIPIAQPNNITVSNELQGHLDGITVDNKGVLWISDWISGDIFTMSKQGKTKKMYNFGQGTADISYAPELNLLAVPQMGQNKLIFIKL